MCSWLLFTPVSAGTNMASKVGLVWFTSEAGNVSWTHCYLLRGEMANTNVDLILSFFDVEGNYFTVLGYRYTTILRYAHFTLTSLPFQN